MQPFQTLDSIIAYLPIPNVDTDMIIPKQYLKTIKRTGLGKTLFAELRYDESGKPKPDFILNHPRFSHANILLAEENFGCGSSREHAVWALLDFGIKVIIAPSFADIFYNNCFKNGILPIILPKEQVNVLAQEKNAITVNLELQNITTATLQIPFFLDSFRRDALLQGLDEIGETLLFAEKITAFEEKQKIESPWYFGTHQ